MHTRRVQQNTYKLLSLETQWKVVKCRSVTFDEENLTAWKEQFKYEKPDSDDNNKSDDMNMSQDEQAAPRQPTRQKKPNEKQDMLRYAYLTRTSDDEPITYKEAMNCPDSPLWEKAMKEEIESLMDNETWKLVALPKGRKAISCRWVFKIKKIDGKVDRYKARLVAKGFMQKLGVDYFETYSPVASLDTIRLIACEAFLNDMTIDQLDIKTAYLYGSLDEEIYMRQPKGFKVKGKEDLVCLLMKGIYGLKQAGRNWHKTLIDFLSKLGYKQCMKDRCVFIKKTHKYIVIIIVYVDDIVIASNNENKNSKRPSRTDSKPETWDLCHTFSASKSPEHQTH